MNSRAIHNSIYLLFILLLIDAYILAQKNIIKLKFLYISCFPSYKY